MNLNYTVMLPKVYNVKDHVFYVRTVNFQTKSIYFQSGPNTLLIPYTFKDHILYFSRFGKKVFRYFFTINIDVSFYDV